MLATNVACYFLQKSPSFSGDIKLWIKNSRLKSRGIIRFPCGIEAEIYYSIELKIT